MSAISGGQNMMSLGYGGAVYNGQVRRYMDYATKDLKKTLKEWPRKHWFKRALLLTFAGWDVKLEAIKDLIEARKNPNGSRAKNLNPKIKGWRHDLALHRREPRIIQMLFAP
jgi:hypothetical protein